MFKTVSKPLAHLFLSGVNCYDIGSIPIHTRRGSQVNCYNEATNDLHGTVPT